LLLGREGRGQPEIDVVPEVLEAPLHDADDAIRRAVEPDVASDERRIAAVSPLPEVVRQHHSCSVSRFAILIGDGASDMRCSAEQAIERRRRAKRIDALGAIRHAERQADAAIQRLLRKRPDVVVSIEVVRHRRGHHTGPRTGEPELRIQVLDQHEPVGVSERERLEEHRSHDAEDHRVAAETNEESRQDGECEAALAGPASHRKSRVTKHLR
jgi:hypothetical protein